MNTLNCDLIIIGAGPGGYELAALEAAKGKNVVIIERQNVGGTCLNRGCIPTKCLCAEAESDNPDFQHARTHMDEVITSLREDIDRMLAGCTRVLGSASLDSDGNTVVGDTTYIAPRTVIATGSAPSRLNIPGADLSITSDDLLSASSLPESLCIIGGGVIGLEMASALNALGVKVSVVEYMGEILPGFDKAIGRRLRSSLSRQGIKIIVNAQADSITRADNSLLTVSYTSKGRHASIEAGAVLMSVGRKPVTPDGIIEAGINLDKRGHIIVDDNLNTSRPGIMAIGDCCSAGPMLAHVASAQARHIAGQRVNLNVIPSVVFTSPRVAMTGITAEQADSMLTAQGIEEKAIVTRVPYSAVGYARAANVTDGFIQAVIHPVTRQILGVHILGAHADDLLGQATLAIAHHMTANDLRLAIQPHPTLSELLPAALV